MPHTRHKPLPTDIEECFVSALFPTNLLALGIGKQDAVNAGMLRITVPTLSSQEVFVLEGKLTGLWAQELLRVARAANQGPGTIFNLQEVFYVDSSGEEALRFLSRRGARFLTDSAYGVDLCKRLKLHRICQQVEDGNAHRAGRIPISTKTNPSGADVLGQQRSGCRE